MVKPQKKYNSKRLKANQVASVRLSKQTHLSSRLRLYRRMSLATIFIGFVCVAIWAVHMFLYTRSISFNEVLYASNSSQSTNSNRPVEIVFGSTRRSIVETALSGSTWVVPAYTVAHVPLSAYPGQSGNIILFGHNKESVLGPLLDVKSGSIIGLVSQDGIYHRYTVTRTRDVDPSHTSYLLPTKTETLTIYTCSGFLDSMRRIVQAEPIQKS